MEYCFYWFLDLTFLIPCLLIGSFDNILNVSKISGKYYSLLLTNTGIGKKKKYLCPIVEIHFNRQIIKSASVAWKPPKRKDGQDWRSKQTI